MQRARGRLREVFPDIAFTDTVVSAAWGMEAGAPDYVNMLATFHTEHSEQELVSLLKDLEQELGDTAALRKDGTVMMDLDILRFAGRRRHLEDWQRPYVKQLIGLLKA